MGMYEDIEARNQIRALEHRIEKLESRVAQTELNIGLASENMALMTNILIDLSGKIGVNTNDIDKVEL